MLDDVDRRILALLQQNARTTNAEIARKLAMAPSAIFERIKKLEDRGVLLGYEARVNAKALGKGLVAFVFVRATDRANEHDTGGRLARIPDVQEVHQIAGDDCYLVKVRVADTDALLVLLRDKIGSIASVVGTRTTIVLGTEKETTRLALGVIPGAMIDG